MTRITFIADTHGYHNHLALDQCDILVHCGDFTRTGSMADALEFLNWFEAQPAAGKVLIAGNHDWIAEQNPSWMDTETSARGIHYLQDSGIELAGLKFWGSPITPEFNNWAFNRVRGRDIARHWKCIPADTEILITHGPPNGILDLVKRGNIRVGCVDLRYELQNRVYPMIHAFGHIHEQYGTWRNARTEFINASICNDILRPVNYPVVKVLKI